MKKQSKDCREKQNWFKEFHSAAEKRLKEQSGVGERHNASPAPPRGEENYTIKRGNHAAWALSTLRDALLRKTCQKTAAKKGSTRDVREEFGTLQPTYDIIFCHCV